MNSPSLILADEPTGNLDSKTGAHPDIIDSLNKEGVTVIVVTHDRDVAARAGRTVFLRDGLVERGARTANEAASDDPVETVLLALRNLKANKLRTFLSVLGVMVGVGAVITVISVGMSAQAEIARNISDLGSNMIAVVPNLNASQDPRKVMKFMTLELSARMLEAAPALSAVSAVAQSNATLTYRGEPTTASLTGIEPEYARIMTTKIALGRGIVHSDLDSSSHVIVLGSAVARDLFADLDPIGRQAQSPWASAAVLSQLWEWWAQRPVFSDMDRQASYQSLQWSTRCCLPGT